MEPPRRRRSVMVGEDHGRTERLAAAVAGDLKPVENLGALDLQARVDGGAGRGGAALLEQLARQRGPHKSKEVFNVSDGDSTSSAYGWGQHICGQSYLNYIFKYGIAIYLGCLEQLTR